MKRNNSYNRIRALFISVSIIVVCRACVVEAGRTGWKRQEVDWRITGGDRIKAIRYSEDKAPSLYNGKGGNQPEVVRKRILLKESPSENGSINILSLPSVMANVIDSPPIDGFVPRIAISVTDDSSDDFDWVAQTHMSVEPPSQSHLNCHLTGWLKRICLLSAIT